jgi:hypothetical protein
VSLPSTVPGGKFEHSAIKRIGLDGHVGIRRDGRTLHHRL